MVDIRRSVSSTFLQLKPMGRIMPITEQQLLQILPNAGPRAGVFVGARHAVPRRSLRR